MQFNLYAYGKTLLPDSGSYLYYGPRTIDQYFHFLPAPMELDAVGHAARTALAEGPSLPVQALRTEEEAVPVTVAGGEVTGRAGLVRLDGEGGPLGMAAIE